MIVKATRFVTVMAIACWLSSSADALAQRSGAGRSTGRAAGASDGANGREAPSVAPVPGGSSAARPVGVTVPPVPPGAGRNMRRTRPLLWWPYAPIEVLSPVSSDDGPRKQPEAASPPVAARRAPESSSIQPLPPTDLPRTSPQVARGNLRLEVGPNTAGVYVDGFYMGTVEDSNGSSTELSLTAGWHRLEFRAPGFETPAVNVTIQADRTTSYRGELKPIGR